MQKKTSAAKRVGVEPQMRYDLMCCLSECLVYSGILASHTHSQHIYCTEDDKMWRRKRNQCCCMCTHIYLFTNKHQTYEYFGLVERFLVSMIVRAPQNPCPVCWLLFYLISQAKPSNQLNKQKPTNKWTKIVIRRINYVADDDKIITNEFICGAKYEKQIKSKLTHSYFHFICLYELAHSFLLFFLYVLVFVQFFECNRSSIFRNLWCLAVQLMLPLLLL